MQKIKNLSIILKQLNGIGPKQAERIALEILNKDQQFLNNLSQQIQNIKKGIRQCSFCQINFEGEKSFCPTCLSTKKEKSKILIITTPKDKGNFEKINIWNGIYFLIHKNLKITEKKINKKINITPLLKGIKNGKIKEIVFALSFNPEGEFTKDYIKNKILELKKDVKISELAKGIPLGAEIEYAD